MNFQQLLILALALLQDAPLLVSGHGNMVEPAPRQLHPKIKSKVNCPHCGQGKGKKPGICGDPFQSMSFIYSFY
jgi:hypothetical protein